MDFAVVLDKLANNLKLVVRPNVKVGLHALNDRLVEVLRVYLEHDLERESLQDGQLTAEIIRVLVDWQPDLHGVVCILAVDLVQIEAIVHRLLDADDVVVVADIEPVVEHGLHPALAMQ